MMIATAFTLIAVFAAFWIGGNAILHPKRRPLEERHHLVRAKPSDYGIKLTPLSIPVAGDVRLKGFLVYPDPDPGEASRTRRMWKRLDEAGVERSPHLRGTVILLHGRGGTKDNMLTVAQRFVAANFRCVVYDARAHAESEGKICTYGKQEKDDLTVVLDFVERKIEEQGETLGPVLAFGSSLGAAVTLQAAPQEKRIVGVVAVAPFASLDQVITRAIGKVTRNRLPDFLRNWIFQYACWRGRIDPAEVRPEESAKQIEAPVFVVHGEKDGVIPLEHAERIFENLPAGPHRFAMIPGAFHGNVLAEGGDDLYEEMIHFYLECIGARDSSDSFVSARQL